MRVILRVSISSLSLDSVAADSASAAFSRSTSCVRSDSVTVACASAACSSLIWSASLLESSWVGPRADGLIGTSVALIGNWQIGAKSQAIGVPSGHL